MRAHVRTMVASGVSVAITAIALLSVSYMQYHERYPTIDAAPGEAFTIAEQRRVEEAIPTQRGERVISMTKTANGLFEALVAPVSWLHPNPRGADVYLIDLRTGVEVAKVSHVDF